MTIKDHAVILYLNPKLRLGTIKLQAEMELGPSYAALYIYNEGLHALKKISDEDYLVNQKRYSKKLVDDAQQKLVAEVNTQALKELSSMTKLFSGVLADWSLPHHKGWKAGWVKRASNYAGRIKAAQMIVELGSKELDAPC